MKLQVLYFARLREVFDRAAEQVELSGDAADVAALIASLRSRGQPWDAELAPGRTFRVAVDQEMATLQTPLRAGAEVAIFPPVTGG
jgi:molybdopterin synthase sulfur carrier subunit